MAEIFVLGAMPAALLVFILLFWRASRREQAELEAGLRARGWQMAASAAGTTINVPFAGRSLALEGYTVQAHRSHELRFALRHVGVAGLGDLQVFPAARYAADKLRAGLVEVSLPEQARGSLRAFATDPAGFLRVLGPDVLAALAAAKWPADLSVERGTLSMTFPQTFDLALLDRMVAIFQAIAAPSAARLPALHAGVRPTTAAVWGCAVGAGLLLGLITGIIGAAVVPLPDHSIGRAISTPVVCPNGGVPDAIHYSHGRGGSWNVTCEKKAEKRTLDSIHEPGAYEPCAYPGLTTGILSFEVYFLFVALIVTLVTLLAAKVFGSRAA